MLYIYCYQILNYVMAPLNKKISIENCYTEIIIVFDIMVFFFPGKLLKINYKIPASSFLKNVPQRFYSGPKYTHAGILK